MDTSLRFMFCANARFTLFFFFLVWHVFVLAKLNVRLLFMHCLWTVTTLFDFSTYFQPHQWVPCIDVLLFFIFIFWHAFISAKLKVRLLFMYCSWTVVTLFDFLTYFQPHQWICALFTRPTNFTFQQFFY